MTEVPFDVVRAHRWFAIESNNRSWVLLEQASRTKEEIDELLHSAHVAYFHWVHVGTAINRVRGLYLLADAHAEAGFGASSTEFARQCLELHEHHLGSLSKFDVACVYECVARAHASDGKKDLAKEWKEKAREAGSAFRRPKID